ncbi:MAG: DNA adenine methylase [Actinobacteria bacterium]|nr:DNA adenine methylase [Actinomycetota bacterium]MBM3713881.1 DNA adenine methylase [Actinomycetota bacterium]
MENQEIFNSSYGAEPFLKWAGGKRQLLSAIKEHLPKKFKNYFEPFVGGGATFFHLYNNGLLKNNITLIDNNPELINAYITVKNNAAELLLILEELKKSYLKNPHDFYYELRNWDRQDKYEKRSSVERAARTIFLNKTCFNGLYRVNSKGFFNVPLGRYKNPNIFNRENILSVLEALKKVDLLCDDFSVCLKTAKACDFIYFDPPYFPISKTSCFTGYTKEEFGTGEQKRLRDTFAKLSCRGCFLMLSNSGADFIKNLYKDFNIYEVSAKRFINCVSEGRGPIKELLVTNY